MKKTQWVVPALVLVLALTLTGCGKADALAQGRWQRVEYLPEETAEAFLTSLDLTAGEIAAAPKDLGIVRQAEFTGEKTYRFRVDSEATRTLAREYLDSVFSALAADGAALSAVYDEAFGVDMAAMDEDSCKAFYARLYGCADYNALLDHLAAALFDYEALDTVEEQGRFTVRGSRIILSDPEGNDRGYVEFTLSESSLILRYGSTTEEYTNIAG